MICALPGNEQFAERLRELLGEQVVGLEYRRFPDGESYVRLLDSVKDREITFVCTLNDPDAKTMALLFAARTAKELGAVRVGLVAPYLGYMRQDRRFKDGEAVTSVHFAKVLSQGFDWIATVDPHLHRRSSLAEIYSIPAVNVAAAPALAAWIRQSVERPLILGPDSESEQWAAEVARECGAPYAVMQKTRLGDRSVRIEAPAMDGWKDRTPVLIDDIVSSARTMALAATRIREAGLAAPVCVGVHAIFAPGAENALHDAGITKVVTTNTVPHQTNAIEVAPLVAKAIGSVAEQATRKTRVGEA